MLSYILFHYSFYLLAARGQLFMGTIASLAPHSAPECCSCFISVHTRCCCSADWWPRTPLPCIHSCFFFFERLTLWAAVRHRGEMIGFLEGRGTSPLTPLLLATSPSRVRGHPLCSSNFPGLWYHSSPSAASGLGVAMTSQWCPLCVPHCLLMILLVLFPDL